jgi:AraC-like DNA-binding protein
MPLFMDYHKGLSASVEDVKRAHIADEAVQNKYGVVYHQFWVNEEDGTVFCLMEGPDKEACAAVHREAHGNVACSVVEVAPGFYELLMGRGHVIDQGHVRNQDGSADTGSRCILVLKIHGVTSIKKSSEYKALRTPHAAKRMALSHISEFGGREVTWLYDDSLVSVFDSTQTAVRCAIGLQKSLCKHRTDNNNHEWNIVFRMGLSAGQPLTENGDLFSETIKLARRLCSVANPNELILSTRMAEMCDVEGFSLNSDVRILSDREQSFVSDLFAISEEKLADELFTVESLSRNIGMSRPQLYRKVVAITGKSPNDFLRDLRMEKALSLLKQRAGNVSEIALEVGYSNPSYFAKCFQLRFGCTPSRFMNSALAISL